MTISSIQRPATLQPLTRLHTGDNTASFSFDSITHQDSYLMDQLMQQATIFAALQLASHINQLNNRQVISRYQIVKIKSHFMKIEMSKCGNQKSKYQNSEYQFSEYQKSKNQKSKVERDHFIKQYQKSYMKLISNQIDEKV